MAINDLAGDLLKGTAKIGEFLGDNQRRAQHLIDSGAIPAFKLGGRLCARKSTLLAFIAEREAAAMAPKDKAEAGK